MGLRIKTQRGASLVVLTAPQALSENNCRAMVALLFGCTAVVLNQLLIKLKGGISQMC